MYKKSIIFCLVTILIVLTIYVSINHVILFQRECNGKIGIIDGNISIKNQDINYNDNLHITIDETHGDSMINFVQSYCKKYIVYYYDAAGINGIINTQKIIEGLEWLKQNKVQYVNLSLSSKRKSEDLNKWIEENNLRIYSSYSNLLNTSDYPAMYDKVIASGSNNMIDYKNNDVRYSNNNVLLFNGKFELYKGNSYLSIVSLINDLR